MKHSKEWLRLLHMEKKWNGSYQSSIRGDHFFLAKDGSSNPGSELEETFRLMFLSSVEQGKKIQCQYLARRDFFIRNIREGVSGKLQDCKLSDDWLKKLNTTKISLIFASAYMNSASSSFGHTFLKLQNPENENGKELLDYGINFAARTADSAGALYALYGLFGYFPGSFSMSPYHQMIKEYTHLEGRDLWEYNLNFTAEEVQRILFHLLELEGSHFDYYFLDDNCSFALLKVLEIGRPGLDLIGDDEMFVIPIDTLKRVQPLVTHVRYRAALDTDWRIRRDRLAPTQRKNLQQFHENPTEEKIEKMDLETLSAAQFLITLKELEDHKKWKDLNYHVARARAQMGVQKQTFQLDSPSVSPDQGPHSSAVEIGFLEQQETSYFLSGIRLAFHDQLSRNEGASPFSHLEVLGFQWQASHPQQTILRKYRLIETLSTQGIDAFDKPLSWGVSLGADNDFKNQTRLRHHVTGRFGYSFDFLPDQVRWVNLVAVGLQQDPDQNFQFTPGFDSRLWILWRPQIRSLIQYEYWRFPTQDFQKTSIVQAFDLTRQLELRLGWQSYQEGSSTQLLERRVSLIQNFLF